MVDLSSVALAVAGGGLALWSFSSNPRHWLLFLIGIIVSVFGLVRVFS